MNKREVSLVLIVSLFLFVFLFNFISARTIYVPADYADIPAAVANATHGDTILVAPGTYIFNSRLNITKNITLKSVNGANNTIIRRNVSAGSFGVILITNFTTGKINATVDGFTIANGSFLCNGGCSTIYNYGIGGNVLIFISPDSLVKNCILENGHADQYGGGVAIDNGGTVDSSIIRNNEVSGSGFSSGGGVFISEGGTVSNSLIYGNNGAAAGGGLYFRVGSTIIPSISYRNIISNNTGGAFGGGGVVSSNFVANAIVKIIESVVYFNTGGTNIQEYSALNATYTISTPLLDGVGNNASNPGFVGGNITDPLTYFAPNTTSIMLTKGPGNVSIAANLSSANLTQTLCPDADGDGYCSDAICSGGDCNDNDATINPKTVWYQDADSDGYASNSTSNLTACTAPTGYVALHTDCNDADSAINPGKAEIWNSVDDNCNSLVDDGVSAPSSGGSSGSSVSVSSAQISSGFETAAAPVGTVFSFTLGENQEGHSLTVLKIFGDKATIKIKSTAIFANLSLGETQKFEINNDSYYDLKVTLNKIDNKKAYFTITDIKELMGSDVVQTSNQTTEEVVPQLTEKEENKNNNSLIIFVSVIVIFGIIAGVSSFRYRAKKIRHK